MQCLVNWLETEVGWLAEELAFHKTWSIAFRPKIVGHVASPLHTHTEPLDDATSLVRLMK